MSTERTVRTRSRPALPPLAERINDAHARAYQAARSAIEHATECGRLLHEAKASVEHGGWLPWIEANLSFGPRQAQKYMRLAQRADELANTTPSSHLTINGALEVLASSRAEPGPVTRMFDETLAILDRMAAVAQAAEDGDPGALSQVTAGIVQVHRLCLQMIDQSEALVDQWLEQSEIGTGVGECTVTGTVVEVSDAGDGYVHLAATDKDHKEVFGLMRRLDPARINDVLKVMGLVQVRWHPSPTASLGLYDMLKEPWRAG